MNGNMCLNLKKKIRKSNLNIIIERVWKKGIRKSNLNILIERVWKRGIRKSNLNILIERVWKKGIIAFWGGVIFQNRFKLCSL